MSAVTDAAVARAHRESRRGASKGRMLPRTGGSDETRRASAREDAAASARDDATERLTMLSESAQDDVSAAYAEATGVVVRRGAVCAETRRRLTRTDPIEARSSR